MSPPLRIEYEYPGLVGHKDQEGMSTFRHAKRLLGLNPMIATKLAKECAGKGGAIGGLE